LTIPESRRHKGFENIVGLRFIDVARQKLVDIIICKRKLRRLDKEVEKASEVKAISVMKTQSYGPWFPEGYQITNRSTVS